jgi:hypothetical protein
MGKYIFIFLFSLLTSCSFPSTHTQFSDSLATDTTHDVQDTIAIVNTDTISLPPIDTPAFISVEGWKNADFIISAKHKNSEGVLRTIANTRAEWKDVPNPFIAVYRGCDFADYFHLTFEDNKGKTYDFGFGNNNFGTYTLFDSEQCNDNKKYLNKSFRIFWNWTPSSFPCCDGEYEKVEAYMPSITKLEITESAITK